LLVELVTFVLQKLTFIPTVTGTSSESIGSKISESKLDSERFPKVSMLKKEGINRL